MKSPQSAPLVFSPDSLARFFHPAAHIIYARLAGDTLGLGSTNDLVFYPFGKCPDFACFRRRCTSLTFGQASDARGVYTGRLKQSYVQVVQTDDRGKAMELVSGELHDPGVAFTNGTHVGMGKTAFLALFFRESLGVAVAPVKVVRVDSGLDGMRHYYTFAGDTLQSVVFVSLLGQALKQ